MISFNTKSSLMPAEIKSIDSSKVASDITEIHTDVITGHHSLCSKKAFRKNEVITEFHWVKEHPTPNYLTIQIGDSRHIELLPTWLKYTNHSCDPNAFFDTTRKELVCIKPIQPGDEITFFYPSSEWEMDRTFDCHCKSPLCLGHIAGAKNLTKQQRSHYRFTDYIRSKF